MDRGYVRLWRKAMDSLAFQDDGLWRLWSMILMEASWKRRRVKVAAGRGFDVVTLEPGQVIFGSRNWSDRLRTPKSTLHRRLKRLEKAGNLSLNPGRHYTIVTICNWDIYQPAEGGRGTESGTPAGRNRDNAKKGKKDRTPPAGAGGPPDAPDRPVQEEGKGGGERVSLTWLRYHCFIPAHEEEAFRGIAENSDRKLVTAAVMLCKRERREKGLARRVCLSDLTEAMEGLHERWKREEQSDGT